MVYLALSSDAAREVVVLAGSSGASVWIGSDGLSDAEYNQAGERGVKISRFIYPLAEADAGTIERAVATVIQHHLNETVWVERPNASSLVELEHRA